MNYEDVLEWFSSGEATVEQLGEIREAINEQLPAEPPAEQSQIVPEELSYWLVEDNPKQIQLGGEVIDLIRRGPSQLKQIKLFKDWLAGYAKPAIDQAFPEGKAKELSEGSGGIGTTIDLVINLLDVDGLLELGCVVTMKDQEFVSEHFDIGWVVDAAGKILKYQPALKKLTARFFGKTG
jgi:5,10-methenyltetrahydromethanopterin hydrogenase